MIRKFLSLQDVADLLCVERRKLRAWVKERKIPYVSMNGEIKFSIDHLEGWLNARIMKPNESYKTSYKLKFRNYPELDIHSKNMYYNWPYDRNKPMKVDFSLLPLVERLEALERNQERLIKLLGKTLDNEPKPNKSDI